MKTSWISFIGALPICFALGFLPLAQGNDLISYRKSMAPEQVAEQRSALQAQKELFAKLLKGTNLRPEALVGLLGQLQTTGNHHDTSSGYVKRIMSKTAEKLEKDFKYGQPIPFDPSDIPAEAEAKLRLHRVEVFSQELGSDAESILKDYYLEIIAQNRTQTEAKAISDNAAKTGLSAEELASLGAIQQWVQPFLDEEGISDALGKVIGVEVLDGILTKIVFSKKTDARPDNRDSLSNSDKTDLSISLLISFRTEFDPFFLSALEGLANIAQEFQEGEKRKTNQLDSATLKLLSENLNAKLQGAREANKILSSLSRKQIDSLLLVFLAFRGDDIPTSVDTAHLSEKLEAATKVGAKASDLKRDYRFYLRLEADLYRLEAFLVEEVQLEIQKQRVLDRIKKDH